MRSKFLSRRMTLKKGVQIIASLEIIICTVIITVFTLLLFDVCFGGKTAKYVEYVLGIRRELQFTLWFVCWMIAFIKVTLDIHLYKKASAKIPEGCQIWLTVTGGALLMNYFWSLMSLHLFWNFRNCIVILSINLLLGVYKGVEMLVVYKLIQRMRKEEQTVFTLPSVLSSVSVDTVVHRSQSETGIYVNLPSSSTLSEYLPPSETNRNSEEFLTFTTHSPI